MNRYIVSFDKSNEDIPTLVVGRESYFALGPGMEIINMITGAEAVRLWNKLSKKTKENKDCDNCIYKDIVTFDQEPCKGCVDMNRFHAKEESDG